MSAHSGFLQAHASALFSSEASILHLPAARQRVTCAPIPPIPRRCRLLQTKFHPITWLSFSLTICSPACLASWKPSSPPPTSLPTPGSIDASAECVVFYSITCTFSRCTFIPTVTRSAASWKCVRNGKAPTHDQPRSVRACLTGFRTLQHAFGDCGQ
ncbi:hypothetical protein BKA62DRAFT_89247 [Auriculariales sp. MPI-PUGE-AT-0066]|nr:hypothetical protein BKA62DRAFT_89247 [Auriculariales sp. MPI-PUGE-AT-0066]